MIISASQTKTLAEGLVKIFDTPAVTYEQKADGSCERVSVTINQINRPQFLKLATLIEENPDEQVLIKRSGEKVHFGFCQAKAKTNPMPEKTAKEVRTYAIRFEQSTGGHWLVLIPKNGEIYDDAKVMRMEKEEWIELREVFTKQNDQLGDEVVQLLVR